MWVWRRATVLDEALDAGTPTSQEAISVSMSVTRSLFSRLETARTIHSPFPGNGTSPFPGNGTSPFPGSGGLLGGVGNCTGFGFPGGPQARVEKMLDGFAVKSEEEGAMSVQSEGDPANVTTLRHVLTMNGLVPNKTIREVVDTQGELMCYEYV